MKKLYLIILLVVVSSLLISCDFFSATTQTTLQNTTQNTLITTAENTTAINTTVITSTEEITTTYPYTETTLPTSTTTMETTTNITTTVATTALETTTDISTQETTTIQGNNPIIPTGYNLLQDELDYIGIPSQGDVKVLVFAVDFSDYPSSSSDINLDDLDIAFNGLSNEIDYESLNSYYLESSYGALNITADIFGFYRAEEPASYYEDEYEKLWAVDPVTGDWMYDDDEVTYPDSDIIYELMLYYDDLIDFSDYDSNNDGFIDGIYVVYTHPVSFTNGSDLWWAYQDFYAYEGDLFDEVEPLYFCWSGTDFLTDSTDDIDARTIIHETGHMLGLEDYYDYSDEDNYNSGGLGGADMMDGAYGDHNPFS